MYKSFFLLAIFAIVNAQVNQPGCGRRPRGDRSDDKIVGGNTAASGDWGWLVSINYNGRHICGGTLIDKQWILTAAHCVAMSSNPAYYTISIGLHDRYIPEYGSQQLRVSKVVTHSSYNTANNQNDVALMKLATPANVNGDTVVIACLYSGVSDLTNVNGWASGWGAQYTGGSSARHKQEVSKPILSDYACRSRFGSMLNTAIQICSGTSGLGRDTCQGDSGGPLHVKASDNLWYQVGIVSYGLENCGDGGVYSRVSYYVPWIKRILSLY